MEAEKLTVLDFPFLQKKKLYRACSCCLQTAVRYRFASVSATPRRRILSISTRFSSSRSSVGFAFACNLSGRKEILRRMRIVGLTGGISSGKSTVSNLFKSNGIPVVDADVVARDVLKKGTGGWKKVVAAFGEEILLPNREVDRPKLGQIVFSDPGKRQLLNRLLAPFISWGIFWQVFMLWIKGSKVIILDIPLLFEAKMDKWTKPIIVVWVDTETQLQRLMARDWLSEEDARNRINAQMPLDTKRTKADIVIDNTGSLDDLNEEFQKVFFEVTKPLTWTEFWLSRQGALLAIVSIIIGVVICWKVF